MKSTNGEQELQSLQHEQKVLLYELGTTRNLNVIDEQKQIIHELTNKIKALKAYIRYNKLREQESTLREMLHEITLLREDMDEKLDEKNAEKQELSNKLLQLRGQMSKVIEARDSKKKISTLERQIEDMDIVYKDIEEKSKHNSMGIPEMRALYLSSSEKKNHMEQEIQEINNQIAELESHLSQESMKWNEAMKEKAELEQKVKQITSKRTKQEILAQRKMAEEQLKSKKCKIDERTEYVEVHKVIKEPQQSWRNYRNIIIGLGLWSVGVVVMKFGM